jgi:hypothetical protein
LTWKICWTYLDDILVYSASFEQHLDNLQQVFDRFRAANSRMNGKKCGWLLEEIECMAWPHSLASRNKTFTSTHQGRNGLPAAHKPKTTSQLAWSLQLL